jgi:hypothetical protein
MPEELELERLLTPAQQEEMRDLANWPYKTLSQRSGVPASTLCAFELGQSSLRPKQRAAVEKVLKAEIVARAKRIAAITSGSRAARRDQRDSRETVAVSE